MVVLRTQIRTLQERSLIIPILQLISSPDTALTSIHKNYGDLVSVRFFNKKLLFVCHPTLIEEVYKQEAKGLLGRDFLCESKQSLFGNGLVNSKPEIWVNQRRLIQPLLSREAMSEWEKVIIDEASSKMDSLMSMENGNFNLFGTLKDLVQQIFVKVLFGRSVDTLTNGESLAKTIDIISDALLPIIVTEIISNGQLMWLMPFKKRKYQVAVKSLSDFLNQEISRKCEQPGHDLISLMKQAKINKTGYGMTEALLKDEAINLLFASQRTTYKTLFWFFYLIGKNGKVHAKVTEEIRAFKNDPLTATNLAKLAYTKATLFEALRLFPPTKALSLQANEDIIIDGQLFTKDTIVILSMYATHRHPSYWEMPNEFNPEHFYNKNTKGELDRYAFFPFGGGLHNCIGRHFAEHEMMIIIVMLLREFTFKTDADINEAIKDTLKPAHDVVISISPLCQGHQECPIIASS